MTEFLQTLNQTELGLARYVTKNPDNPNVPLTNEKQYQRLGDLVAKQLLADPKNRIVVQAIESGHMTYQEVVKNTTDSLKRKHALEPHGDFIPLTNLNNDLRRGTLKGVVVKSVVELATRSAKNPTVQKTTTITQPSKKQSHTL